MTDEINCFEHLLRFGNKLKREWVSSGAFQEAKCLALEDAVRKGYGKSAIASYEAIEKDWVRPPCMGHLRDYTSLKKYFDWLRSLPSDFRRNVSNNRVDAYTLYKMTERGIDRDCPVYDHAMAGLEALLTGNFNEGTSMLDVFSQVAYEQGLLPQSPHAKDQQAKGDKL